MKTMIKEIPLGKRKIQYVLTRKRVKNINLRIKPDGKIFVSANWYISQREIEKFLLSKSDMITEALEKFKVRRESSKIKYFEEKEIRSVILEISRKIYPYYKNFGISYPEIKFRKMKSRWGSCHTQKGVLTFNTELMYAPLECVEYVICHEFTHFLVQNHSKDFYLELGKICPDWKERRKKLKEIILF